MRRSHQYPNGNFKFCVHKGPTIVERVPRCDTWSSETIRAKSLALQHYEGEAWTCAWRLRGGANLMCTEREPRGHCVCKTNLPRKQLRVRHLLSVLVRAARQTIHKVLVYSGPMRFARLRRSCTKLGSDSLLHAPRTLMSWASQSQTERERSLSIVLYKILFRFPKLLVPPPMGPGANGTLSFLKRRGSPAQWSIL